MNITPVVVLTFALLTAAASATAVESGQLRQSANLMSAPYTDASVVVQLPANTRVQIVERRGAWLRVSGGTKSGWVRLHQVRLGEGGDTKTSGEGGRMLWSLKETGRSGATGIVATTGIRGMSAEELKNAKPDPQGVKQMENFRATSDAARSYAQAAGLKEQKVPFLPDSKETDQ
jgi:uncharacterized protein YraI